MAGSTDRKSLLQYRAYSLIGLGRYSEAAQDLESLRLTNSTRLYDFWPRLALAYCNLKLGHKREFETTLGSAIAYGHEGRKSGTAMRSLYLRCRRRVGPGTFVRRAAPERDGCV